MSNYSLEAERQYYRASNKDRTPLPYQHVDVHISHSFGTARFKDRDVLDVGCGEGVYSAFLADQEKARRVVAFDFTDHRMRTGYATALGNLSFVAGDVFHMPFAPRSFDVVFIHLVLHHVRFSLGEAVRCMGDTLRSGGTLMAIEPNFFNPAALLAHWLHNRSNNEGFLSPYKVKRVLEATGFEQVKIGYFWKHRPWAKNPILGSCTFIEAKKL